MPKYKFEFTIETPAIRTIEAESLEEAHKLFNSTRPHSVRRCILKEWKDYPWIPEAMQINAVNGDCSGWWHRVVWDDDLSEKEWRQMLRTGYNY